MSSNIIDYIVLHRRLILSIIILITIVYLLILQSPIQCSADQITPKPRVSIDLVEKCSPSEFKQSLSNPIGCIDRNVDPIGFCDSKNPTFWRFTGKLGEEINVYIISDKSCQPDKLIYIKQDLRIEVPISECKAT